MIFVKSSTLFTKTMNMNFHITDLRKITFTIQNWSFILPCSLYVSQRSNHLCDKIHQNWFNNEDAKNRQNPIYSVTNFNNISLLTFETLPPWTEVNNSKLKHRKKLTILARPDIVLTQNNVLKLKIYWTWNTRYIGISKIIHICFLLRENFISI